mgnify:CR=1 FL=1|tara:strand:- start:379 stop:957 length:579 start_codon:yes stop_codon:yes gene_type:complete
MDDATKLRDVMWALGITGPDLAAKLGVRRETVSRWSTGKRPIPPDMMDAILSLTPVAAVEVKPEPVMQAVAKAIVSCRITEHPPGHIANSTPIPMVGDIVRVAPPHGGPWMQVRWIDGDKFSCWWDQDGTRYADDYTADGLETLYADRLAAGVQWPPKGNISAMPISSFRASKPFSKPQRDGVYRFGILYAE